MAGAGKVRQLLRMARWNVAVIRSTSPCSPVSEASALKIFSPDSMVLTGYLPAALLTTPESACLGNPQGIPPHGMFGPAIQS